MIRRGSFVALLSLLAASCSGTELPGSACEQARTEVIKQIKNVCDEPGYKGVSKFCTKCVANALYSTTGPSDCKCRPLTFDEAFCAFSKDEEAKPGVRAAIDDADKSCTAFVLPTDDAGAPTIDSGAEAAVDAPGE